MENIHNVRSVLLRATLHYYTDNNALVSTSTYLSNYPLAPVLPRHTETLPLIFPRKYGCQARTNPPVSWGYTVLAWVCVCECVCECVRVCGCECVDVCVSVWMCV